MKQADPALADRVPPGQTLTAKWPVLTYGLTPRVDLGRWTFRCFGLVEAEVTWTWADFLELPRVSIVSDVHCVTRWSKLDNTWEGVHIREILSRLQLKPQARYVMVHADPDYTTNLALEDLAQDDV
ncbi:MAG TPA: molybdopterin-dependent oxidoreductase, partial [Methylomirabilota bacterium]